MRQGEAGQHPIVEPWLGEPAFTFGGDEFLFCELDRAMSFRANFTALAICRELESRRVPGVVEIAQANASYLVRFDPDVVAPQRLLGELREIHAHADPSVVSVRTRVVDVPAYYGDPWTHECLMRFRDVHQAPDRTDIEYVAEINGLDADGFVARHHGDPYLITMVGFVPGTAWFHQMVRRERMLEVPKYVRPRTDTPERSLAAGGAFTAIYPVRGPGGYQLFAMCALPIFDPTQSLPDFRESFALFRPGDVAKFRPIGREEYDELRVRVEEGTARYRLEEVDFRPQAFLDDPEGTNAALLERLGRMIEVVEGGLFTTVQDEGRFGLYHLGMPPSGALDGFSYRAANLLVGNDEGAAVLEATLHGPTLRFQRDGLIAITGADLPPRLDGEDVPPWTALAVRADQVLSFDYLQGGARAYIAVAGGIDVPVRFGSRSTYALCRIGGHEGRPIAGGDVLPCFAPAASVEPGRSLPEALRPTFAREWELRVVMGLCDYRLSTDGRAAFLETAWKVTPSSDRIGYRYRGGELAFEPRDQPFGAGSDPSNVVDVGYPVGSIQVPGGNEPICLLNDAVTGGGYATIGTVISADRDVLAQTRTHDVTRFRAVELDEALAARAERRQRLDAMRAALAR